MVRIAEFKGLSLITLRLSYNSTAIELKWIVRQVLGRALDVANSCCD